MISNSQNSYLVSISSPIEIKTVICSIHSLKALDLDGFQPLFYKQCWRIVENEVVKEIQSFFITGVLKPNWNFTFISLIPKISKPTKINHFKPISLYNVLYKIISWILVKCLQGILSNHIFPFQVAFIPSHWIVENTLIAQEVTFSICKKVQVKNAL